MATELRAAAPERAEVRVRPGVARARHWASEQVYLQRPFGWEPDFGMTSVTQNFTSSLPQGSCPVGHDSRMTDTAGGATRESPNRQPSTIPDADEWIPVAVGRLVREFQPLKVILFGSRARGDARPDSDVDLLVVLPWVDDKRAATVAMLRVLNDRLIPVDLVVTDPGEILRRGHLVGTVLRPALREGRCSMSGADSG
jgi:uncharacterized protein